jgi:hypothetical protein
LQLFDGVSTWQILIVIAANDKRIYLHIPIQAHRLTLNPIVGGVFGRVFLDLKRTVQNTVGTGGYTLEMFGIDTD